MRTLTKEPPHHPAGSGADPKQDIPTEQRRKSNSRLFQRRGKHWYGGGRIRFNNRKADKQQTMIPNIPNLPIALYSLHALHSAHTLALDW